MKTTVRFNFLLYISVALPAAGCDAYLDLDAPRNQLVTDNVFADNGLANGAVAGIYQEMALGRSTHFASGGSNSVTVLMDVAAGTLAYNLGDADVTEFADRQWLPTNNRVYTLWASAYKSIFRANEALEGLLANPGVTPGLANQLLGEALFVRAFCHAQLVPLFGDIPLAVTADYRITQRLPRSTIAAVYGQVEQDLREAIDLLPADYAHAQGERVRPNRWAASLLLARIYLYQQQWQMAADMAGRVIERTEVYQLEDDVEKLFLKNNREAIWQLMCVETNGTNTYEGLEAIPTDALQVSPVYNLSQQLLQVLEGDRRGAWVGYYLPASGGGPHSYPFKYKVRVAASGSVPTEYSMVLRLTEAYLIRAEARLAQGNVEDAVADVNALRTSHGGLDPLEGLDEVMTAIERERLAEFFYEWGHRWADLKRWGRNGILLPIPQRELEANPFLVQNDNY